MNVASILRAISASFIDGKSVNFCALNLVPCVLCWVTQLVTGQVRCHVTGRKPTVNSARTSPEAGVAVEGELSM